MAVSIWALVGNNWAETVIPKGVVLPKEFELSPGRINMITVNIAIETIPKIGARLTCFPLIILNELPHILERMGKAPLIGANQK